MNKPVTRVLFFIEPRIDLQNAYLRKWWLKPFCLDMMKTLQQSERSDDFEYCIAMNDPLEMKFGMIEGAVNKYFTQKELYPLFIGDSVELATSWYRGTWTEEQMSHYVSLMKDKFEDFVPDIIILFLPAPYLKEAFPQALLLQHEAFVLSQLPYPPTMYFDPFGPYYGKSSFLNEFAQHIKSFDLNDNQQRLLNDFKGKIQAITLGKSPFTEMMNELRKKFDYLVLLPLVSSGHFAFDGITKLGFKDEYQNLVYILDHVPQHIGVIVTYPPALQKPFNEDTIQYLKERYPHFIYHDSFEEYLSVSQFLIAHVDAVVGLTTGVCFQTLFWDIKFLDLGDSHIIADATGLNDIEHMLEQESCNKDSILYWILTRYTIQRKYLHDPKCFPDFLARSLNKFRSSGITFDFFEPVDTDEKIFGNLINGLDENIPQINNNMSYYKLKRSYDEIKARYDELKSKDVFLLLNEMMKSGEELFQEGKVEEANNLFLRMLEGTNRIKGDLMNNLAVIHVHEGRLDQAERFLNYLIQEGYLSEEAAKNLEMVLSLKKNIPINWDN